jgi:hypothetical protein
MIIIAIAPAITIPAIPPGERADPGCCVAELDVLADVAELDVMADVVGTDELVMGTDELVVDVLVMYSWICSWICSWLWSWLWSWLYLT